MKERIKIAFAFLVLTIGLSSNAQQKIDINGYVKYMHTVMVLGNTPAGQQLGDALLTENLIHNRFNFTYYPSNSFLIKAEFRNRLMYGEQTELYAQFPDLDIMNMLDAGNDVLPLSVFIAQTNAFNWHILMDRLYGEYSSGNTEIRIGRQRVNWGINTFWNPNDIFNAFNFFDFDYEERPGADAVRFTQYIGNMSSIEFAAKYFDDFDQFTGAVLYKTVIKNYDVQFMGGIANQDAVIGGGWAGYIKDKYGFKGEFTYFQPYESLDSNGIFVMSLGTDFALKNDWMIMLGALYNEQSGTPNTNLFDITNTQTISAKTLSNTPLSIMIAVSKAINPRLSWSVANMISPENKGVMIANTLSYSLKENWDIDFVSQVFGQEAQDLQGTTKWLPIFNGQNLRLKFSY